MSELNNRAFAQAKRVVEKRNSIPILSMGRVKKNVLYATDMDIWFEHKVENLKDGLYHVHKSAAINEPVPDSDGHDVSDFPAIHEMAIGEFYEFECAAIREVGKFASTESARHYLNGVFFTPGVIVATDGHTMCRKHIEHGFGPAIMTNKTVGLIPVTGHVRIAAAKSSQDTEFAVIHVNKNLALKSKMIDGRYPDFNRAIPNPDSPLITATQDCARKLPDDWYEQAERKLKLARVENKTAYVNFNIGGDRPCIMGFTAEYLMRLPRAAREFYCEAVDQPARFDIGNSTYVVMPVRA